jgi:hypothetical protein
MQTVERLSANAGDDFRKDFMDVLAFASDFLEQRSKPLNEFG